MKWQCWAALALAVYAIKQNQGGGTAAQQPAGLRVVGDQSIQAFSLNAISGSGGTAL